MGAFGAWRYKNKVLHVADAMVSCLGPNKAKMFLRVGFWGTGWKSAVRINYEKGISPVETAVHVITASLRGVIANTLTPDQRAMTLFAIKSGNKSDPTANHLMDILEGVRRIADDLVFRAAIFEVIGALEGHSGDGLNSYRDARLLEYVLEQHQKQ